MGVVVKFPDKEFILRCRKCKVNAFYVILNSNDPYDTKYYECAECGDIFTLKEIEEQLRNKHENNSNE